LLEISNGNFIDDGNEHNTIMSTCN